MPLLAAMIIGIRSTPQGPAYVPPAAAPGPGGGSPSPGGGSPSRPPSNAQGNTGHPDDWAGVSLSVFDACLSCY